MISGPGIQVRISAFSYNLMDNAMGHLPEV
jgi:hypothetical protein